MFLRSASFPCTAGRRLRCQCQAAAPDGWGNPSTGLYVGDLDLNAPGPMHTAFNHQG
ncbi:MAG: hypothetical protein R3E31_07720 [Chloroflexota bacterium]